MRFVLTLVLLLMLALPAHATQDATSAWNSVCATYHFASAGGTFIGTFAQGYSGSDFTSDFGKILAAVAQTMGTTVPIYTGDELMTATVQNWPDS
jgi:uncharacterized membrane protein YdjX (TVP38/TMEM64 family)